MECKIEDVTVPDEMENISPSTNVSRGQTSGSSAENSQKKLDFFSSAPNRSSRSGSAQELWTKKRSKYAHVESKVKKFIDDLPPPRHVAAKKNKFMRHRSMPDSVGHSDQNSTTNLAEFWKAKFDVLSQEHERVNCMLSDVEKALLKKEEALQMKDEILQKKDEEALVAQRLLEECQLGMQNRKLLYEESEHCEEVVEAAADANITENDVHHRPVKRSKRSRIKKRLAKLLSCGKCNEGNGSYNELGLNSLSSNY